MLIMLFACSENDILNQDQVNDEGLTSSESNLRKASGPVFNVYPNGVDDTENIVQAFADAKAAGPGAVVQLEEGEFFTSIVEVHDFIGTFQRCG